MAILASIIVGMAVTLTAHGIYAEIRYRADERIWKNLKGRYDG